MARFLRGAAPAPRIWAAATAVLVSAGACAASVEPTDQAAFDQAVAATCDKSVVILGEASHGDGHGDAMKVALVEQLVSRCGFNGVLFEASYYEFLPVARNARQGKPVFAALVAAAVGGLWKFDREVQPLFDFLAQQVDAGKIQLGGLDFQAGGLEQPFGNEAMFAELTASLAPARRDACRGWYRSRVLGDDQSEGLSERTRDDGLKACLASIQLQAAGPSIPSREKSEQAAELANLKAWLDAGNQPPPIFLRDRDAMMVTNALRFFDALAKPAKVVIWAHNGHAARNTAALPDYGGQRQSRPGPGPPVRKLPVLAGDHRPERRLSLVMGQHQTRSRATAKLAGGPRRPRKAGRIDIHRHAQLAGRRGNSLRRLRPRLPPRPLGRCVRRHAGAGFRISAARQPALKAGGAAVRALLATRPGVSRRRPR